MNYLETIFKNAYYVEDNVLRTFIEKSLNLHIISTKQIFSTIEFLKLMRFNVLLKVT